MKKTFSDMLCKTYCTCTDFFDIGNSEKHNVLRKGKEPLQISSYYMNTVMFTPEVVRVCACTCTVDSQC